MPDTIVIGSTGAVVAHSVQWATSFRDRTRGLMGQDDLALGHALVISPARQIHTFGMRFPIDVVFCDEEGTILHLLRALRPRRITRWVAGARYAIEMRAGSLPPDLTRGDRLLIG